MIASSILIWSSFAFISGTHCTNPPIPPDENNLKIIDWDGDPILIGEVRPYKHTKKPHGQGGPYVPIQQKVVIVRLVLKISIIDTNIIQKSYKNTFFLKVTRV